jgi:hypothetical protein
LEARADRSWTNFRLIGAGFRGVLTNSDTLQTDKHRLSEHRGHVATGYAGDDETKGADKEESPDELWGDNYFTLHAIEYTRKKRRALFFGARHWIPLGGKRVGVAEAAAEEE